MLEAERKHAEEEGLLEKATPEEVTPEKPARKKRKVKAQVRKETNSQTESKDPPDDGGDDAQQERGPQNAGEGTRRGQESTGREKKTQGNATEGSGKGGPSKEWSLFGVPPAELRQRTSIPIDELQLGRELGRGMTGVVRKGVCQGRVAAIKMSDLASGYTDVPILRQEVAIYQALGSLQGDAIPELLQSGWTFTGAAFFLATALVDGVTLDAFSGEAAQLAKLQRDAKVKLQKIHALDVKHGDIRPENLIVSTGAEGTYHIVFLDFGLSRKGASAAEKAEDIRALTAAFQSVQQGLRSRGTLGDHTQGVDSRRGSGSGAAPKSVKSRLPLRLSNVPNL